MASAAAQPAEPQPATPLEIEAIMQDRSVAYHLALDPDEDVQRAAA